MYFILSDTNGMQNIMNPICVSCIINIAETAIPVISNQIPPFFLSFFLSFLLSFFLSFFLSFVLSFLVRGLRHGSEAARLLGLWVRIVPGLGCVSCECCVLLGRVLCVGLITRSPTEYGVCKASDR
jgi:hypothetical protein